MSLVHNKAVETDQETRISFRRCEYGKPKRLVRLPGIFFAHVTISMQVVQLGVRL